MATTQAQVETAIADGNLELVAIHVKLEGWIAERRPVGMLMSVLKKAEG